MALCLGFAFPFMVNGLLDKVGFRWTLRIWAIGMAVVAGFALLGVKPRVPIPKYQRGQNRPRLIPVRMHFLRRPIFWTFVSFVARLRFSLLNENKMKSVPRLFSKRSRISRCHCILQSSPGRSHPRSLPPLFCRCSILLECWGRFSSVI